MTHSEAIAAFKAFIASDAYDGNIGANFEADRLLWAVRLSHPHNNPTPRMRTPSPSTSPSIDEIVIDLEELGL